MALALMPHETVEVAYNQIKDDVANLSDPLMYQLMSYVERNWMVDIDMWNVSKLDNRTTNFCEGKIRQEMFSKTSRGSSRLFSGYHNRMNHRIHRHHPNIWKFIKFMQAEEARVKNVITQFAAGASKKPNPRTTFMQKRLDTLYRRFEDGVTSASDLLCGLSLLIGHKL